MTAASGTLTGITNVAGDGPRINGADGVERARFKVAVLQRQCCWRGRAGGRRCRGRRRRRCGRCRRGRSRCRIADGVVHHRYQTNRVDQCVGLGIPGSDVGKPQGRTRAVCGEQEPIVLELNGTGSERKCVRRSDGLIKQRTVADYLDF